MARELLNALGPYIDQSSALVETSSTSSPTGVDFPTTPTPPHGSNWIRFDNTATAELDWGAGIESITSSGYDWWTCRGFRLSGTLSSGEVARIIRFAVNSRNPLDIEWVYSSGTNKWKIRVRDSVGVIATGTTEFETDTTYSIRMELDGTNVTIWVNGSQEIQSSSTSNLNYNRMRLTGTDLTSGQTMFFNRMALWTSTAESDRPGVSVECDQLTLSGDTSEDDYADHNDCTVPNSGAATYTYWDDWDSGAPDGATTFNCGAGEDWSQLSALNTHTVDGVIGGVIYRCWQAANADSKTIDNWARLGDGTNTTEVQLPNIGSTTYISRLRAFDLAPDGGAWTQTDIDNLEAGHRVVDANNAVAHVSAVSVEVVAVNDDPPAVGDRRRAPSQVI